MRKDHGSPSVSTPRGNLHSIVEALMNLRVDRAGCPLRWTSTRRIFVKSIFHQGGQTYRRFDGGMNFAS